MSSLYELVFSQSQQQEEAPVGNVKDGDEQDIQSLDDLEDNNELFRKEAREALIKKRKEVEEILELSNTVVPRRRQRIYARPTMYRTEEEKASLRDAHQRSGMLIERVMRNRWNYFAEEDDDADPGDAVFQKMATEQQFENSSSSDDEDEHYNFQGEFCFSAETKRSMNEGIMKMIPPLRLFGKDGCTFNSYKTRSPPNGNHWPLVVDAPIWCKKKNPIDHHVNQLSFIAARLLLNACGSNHLPSRANNKCRNNHPTALTMDAIGHLYHAPRRSFQHSFAAAFKYAMTLIPSSSNIVDEMDDVEHNDFVQHEQPYSSQHDLIQNQINYALSLWRDLTEPSIVNRKNGGKKYKQKHSIVPEKHVNEEQRVIDGKKYQENDRRRRPRKEQRLHENLAQKMFAKVTHLTPASNFLHIFEMTSSFFLCSLGEILLSDQNSFEDNTQSYQEEDEDDDGIYNIASLYQEEDDNDEKFTSSSSLREYATAVKIFFSDCRKYMKEKFAGDSRLNLTSFPQFMAVQRSQSFLCNSGLLTGTIDEVAEELIQVGMEVLDEPQLKKFFGDVHVTTGIAMIVRSFCSLNSASSTIAAEIVSSVRVNPTDMAYRTPFDIMCLAFRQLNIADDFSGTIEAAANEMYRTSHVFETCWHNDPDNVNAHLWHLASLLGSLLLSSGKLGLLYDFPSNNDDYLWPRGSGQILSIKFPVHEAIRKEASEAFLQLQSFLLPPSRHVIISSLLEWTEAIYLLCRYGNSVEFNSITQLHAWHTICWSKGEKTILSLRRVRQLYKSKVVSTDAFLSILADCIEQNPSDAQLWAELLCILNSSNSDTSQPPDNIEEESAWWGCGRTWWQTVFFEAPHKRFRPNALEKDSIEFLSPETLINSKFFASISLACFAPNNKPFNTHSAGIDFASYSSLTTEWLRPPDDDCDNLYIEESEDENGTFKDKLRRLLPKHWQETIISCQVEEEDELVRLISEFQGCFFKTLYIKIVIACYMFGVNHNFIQQSIRWLFEQCNTQQEHNANERQQQLEQDMSSGTALEILSFLYHYHGIDAKSIL
jgi:hypothetical protein